MIVEAFFREILLSEPPVHDTPPAREHSDSDEEGPQTGPPARGSRRPGGPEAPDCPGGAPGGPRP